LATLSINNLEKLKYRMIDGYEVREIDTPLMARPGTTYEIHAFKAPGSGFTSLFISIYRNVEYVGDGQYIYIRLRLVGVMGVEKCYAIPLSKFEDMNDWVRSIEGYMNDDVNWAQPHPSGVRAWILKN
jgi:hypothetical protein